MNLSEKKKTTKNDKIESLYVSEDMAMDDIMDEALRKGLKKGADELEWQLLRDTSLPSLDDMPGEKEKLLNDIIWKLRKEGSWEEEKPPEPQLSEKDQIALELGRRLLDEQENNSGKKGRKGRRDAGKDNGCKMKSFKKERKLLDGRFSRSLLKGVVGTAVVAMGVFTLSMSSEANRFRILSVWNTIVGEELRVKINKDGNRLIDDSELDAAYSDIKEKTGIDAVKFLYTPEEMEYSDYLINQTAGEANIFYKYENSIITVHMRRSNIDISDIRQFDGKIIKHVKTITGDIDVSITEMKNQNGQNAFAAQFECDNVNYSIWGKMDKEKFEIMIKNICF